MFERPGEKIKNLAHVVFVLGLIGSLILAILFGRTVLQYDEVFSLWRFLIILGIGAVGSYVCSLFLYAIGELVEAAMRNAEQNEQLIRLLQKENEALKNDTEKSVKTSNSKLNISKAGGFRMAAFEEAAPQAWICPGCKTRNQPDAENCKYCGRNRK